MRSTSVKVLSVAGSTRSQFVTLVVHKAAISPSHQQHNQRVRAAISWLGCTARDSIVVGLGLDQVRGVQRQPPLELVPAAMRLHAAHRAACERAAKRKR